VLVFFEIAWRSIHDGEGFLKRACSEGLLRSGLAQDLLAHSSISTTSDIYVYIDPTTAEEATEVLATPIIQ